MNTLWLLSLYFGLVAAATALNNDVAELFEETDPLIWFYLGLTFAVIPFDRNIVEQVGEVNLEVVQFGGFMLFAYPAHFVYWYVLWICDLLDRLGEYSV